MKKIEEYQEQALKRYFESIHCSVDRLFCQLSLLNAVATDAGNLETASQLKSMSDTVLSIKSQAVYINGAIFIDYEKESKEEVPEDLA